MPSGLMVALSGTPPVSPATVIASAINAGNPTYAGSGQSPLMGSGQPTKRELIRETFKASFGGPVYVGAGRFSDQAEIIYFRGLGGSNQFLHGDYQMAIVIPTDPTKPIYGEAVLEDKNNNSSGILGLVLKGTTPQATDAAGRPTQLTFSADPNIYSGIYFVDSSSGTVNITYSKGSATAAFNGLVYTSGLTSPIRNSDLYSRGGRLTPRSGRP